ncbi:MAG: hypothetical protein UR60_C0038G0006 [Candidatus Moranbacteria bacterium GW2011_GWF2_34_56]|nr:MAG: hypothetical protein UR51_C0009G0042 [Candidatus Moranbacteria bacterium GW2011_GWF1_34_10]KKP63823.1 MAG: hypothetical protein UR60_C0038G0006 [Candidatus Moranbacteria bacterium GW2011_GWF2_34_56]HBI17469.1 hypothetical protein [Candidatus Moranbacteria bacterium]
MIRDNKKLNNKKPKVFNRQGFTLAEVIVSIGIFTIIMAGSAGAFANAFKSYKGAKNINENLKNAQYAMNLMSKTFRTSSIKYSTSTVVVVYDYSQATACIRYVFTGTTLTKASSSAPESNCSNSPSPAFSAAIPMTSGSVTGEFNAISSAGDDSGPSSTRVGVITVVMNITNSGGGNSSSARIQSTSSLRDYTVSNVGIDPNNPPN